MLAELQIPCLISKLKVQSLDKQTPKLFTEFFYRSVNNERLVRDSTKSKLEAKRLNQEQTRSEETQPKSKLEAKRLNQRAN